MARKVFVNRDVCLGCALCNSTCPEVFPPTTQDSEYDGDFKCHPKTDANAEEYKEKVEEAIKQCPVQAISWRDE